MTYERMCGGNDKRIGEFVFNGDSIHRIEWTTNGDGSRGVRTFDLTFHKDSAMADDLRRAGILTDRPAREPSNVGAAHYSGDSRIHSRTGPRSNLSGTF